MVRARAAQCARAVIAQEGIQSLYNGLGATCGRNCTFNGIYFGILFVAQDVFPRQASPAADVAQNLAVGCFAGCVATMFKAPFDVVKSRIQNQLPDPITGEKEYRNTVQAMRRIHSAEGLKGLYKGFGPMLARIVLGMSVSYAAFDAALVWMQQQNAAEAAEAAAVAAVAAAAGDK